MTLSQWSEIIAFYARFVTRKGDRETRSSLECISFSSWLQPVLDSYRMVWLFTTLGTHRNHLLLRTFFPPTVIAPKVLSPSKPLPSTRPDETPAQGLPAHSSVPLIYPLASQFQKEPSNPSTFAVVCCFCEKAFKTQKD
ncbi:hypothetical protein TNIN_400571 [Trichonephila inaurata madagascariensis]|uniref:Uncharacterized protein n=1 Tax=Trichonephila inaurata madagascariensis TaxID=2747483 RepID=A0A8X6X188_9ARAC|nr:hypothetical protein TNIN_400571 [Trichonephila inaurata madagascariensis]